MCRKINSSNILKTICALRVVASFTPMGSERLFLALKQESFMPLWFKWQTAGLTHKRLEVMVTLPQGIVMEH